MEKPVLTIALLAAAAGLMLYQRAQDGGGGDQGDDDTSPTAGDDSSNILEDGAAKAMSLVTNWPIGSGPYQDTIQQAADTYGVPVSILAWLLWKESRYSADVISGAKPSRVGAVGIAQFMPDTAGQELGSVDAALDPSQAIPGAARYLAKLYAQVGSWSAALAAYNWGIGNVMRKGLAAAPAETRDYYTTIMTNAGYAV